MSSKVEALGPHVCAYCPPNFRPVVHHCFACPDYSEGWMGAAADHLLLSDQFADHRLAIHQRRAGVPRDGTGFPLLHVSPPGTRPFVDPGFNVHDVPWVESPSFVGTGRPDPKLEEMGFDVWEACAITGMPLIRVYYIQESPRVDDGGTHEIFMECRRADGRYSPIRLWEFRLDILESREAEKARKKKRDAVAQFLAMRDKEGVPIDPTSYGFAYGAGASDEETYFPLGN